ncbi:hypothetical protein SKAU_G00389620 [Synaphobranchus kaupii]|uniref:Glucose-fructose oxidoreductase domain-containing protein 2 n=1 Tax=Synaphobranchus kaupii TaxID=118154 RepID=A0A9Q1EB87_SYNKA|nr:hypothetical protein SKAU_G00389620 [Synaphobranchus kaupii]
MTTHHSRSASVIWTSELRTHRRKSCSCTGWEDLNHRYFTEEPRCPPLDLHIPTRDRQEEVPCQVVGSRWDAYPAVRPRSGAERSQAVWGRTEEEARTLSQELGIPFYTSHTDDVLLHPDVDLVCINIPPPLTRQIAVKALASACH